MLSLIRAIGAAALLLAGVAPALNAGMEPEEPLPDPEPQPTIVRMIDNRFRPARIIVAVGVTVLWSNDEADPDREHNVIARDYRWASSNFLPGETYARTFDAPGTFRYFCDLHGGMTGVVVVE
jgi:plastocyanin